MTDPFSCRAETRTEGGDEMPMPCSVCGDPRRSDIDKELRGSRPRREIAQEFGIAKGRLDRHSKHIAKIPAQDPQDLTEVGRLKAIAQGIVDKTKDEKVRIAALRELRGYLELEARLQQETAGATVLAQHPAFQRFAAELARTVSECGTCQPALVGAMKALGGGDTRSE